MTPAFAFPANSLNVNSAWICEIDLGSATTPVASTATILVKWGTAGTPADGTLLTGALTAGTAVAGMARIRVKVQCTAIGATTKFYCSIDVNSNTLGVTGTTTPQYFWTAAPVTAGSASTVANFLGVAITETIAAAHIPLATGWARLGDRQ